MSTTALMPAQATPLCRVPVGRPISNTQAIVLDAALRPVPSGVVGELFLGGLGVAQGYLGPASSPPSGSCLTPTDLQVAGSTAPGIRPAGSFRRVARPDRAHRRAGQDPRPPHRARRDRGGLLAGAPVHSQAAVSAGTDRRGVPPGRLPGLRRRCARRSELRELLRQRLPESMVPRSSSSWTLPLTPNGKLDRGALPEPEAGRRRAGGPRRAVDSDRKRAGRALGGAAGPRLGRS